MTNSEIAEIVESQEIAKREPAILLAEEPQAGVLQKFPGLSQKRFTDEQAKILQTPIDPDELDILPTGEVYASQVKYRRILNDAFGPGGWGLVPTGDFYQDSGTLCREYSLFAEGRFISSAIGEADFQPNNPRHSKATAAESLKSNALMRCCKDLGIASECWDKRVNEMWIKAKAVAVWCSGVAQDIKGKKKKLWRRKDAPRFEYPWAEQAYQKPEEPPTPAPAEDRLGNAFGAEEVPSVDLRADEGEIVDLMEIAQDREKPARTPPTPTPTQDQIGLPGASQDKKIPPRPVVTAENKPFVTEMAKQKLRIGKRDYYRILGTAGYEHSWQVPKEPRRGIWEDMKAVPDGGTA